jgi:hypothetical protein
VEINCGVCAPEVGITGGTESEGASVTTISADVGTMVDGSGTPAGPSDGRSVTGTEVGRMVGTCAEKKMLMHGYDHDLNGVDGLLSQIFNLVCVCPCCTLLFTY